MIKNNQQRQKIPAVKRLGILLLTLLLLQSAHLSAQEPPRVLTLQDVIELAQTQSPSILSARHSFRAQYWNYVSHRANYLPALSFRSDPNLNRIINPITLPDGTISFVQQNNISNDASFTITQNVALTGGAFTLRSSLQRMDQLTSGTHSYRAQPILLGYRQALFGFNQLRWDRRIAPLRFEEAKRRYVETLESVARQAVRAFFGVAHAQSGVEMADRNLANADTLFVFAQGRYNIGTITQNDMMQLEISKLRAEISRSEAQMSLENSIQSLRAFLGIRDTRPIEVLVDSAIPLLQVDEQQALMYALQNNSDVISWQRQLLEGDANVARAQANTGFRADLFMEFGLAQTAATLEGAFQNPREQQFVGIGIRIPILDWGQGRGQREMARSQRDLAYMQIEQARVNFEMDISQLVRRFNLQAYQLDVAARVDHTAERRAFIAQQMFLLERSTILELNNSVTERDSARRSYISALQSWWELYYQLRGITLFDFRQQIPITEDYQLLIR